MEEAKKMEKWMGRIQPYTGIQISSHLKVPNSVLNARLLKIESENLLSILLSFFNFRNPSPKPVKRKSCPDVSPDARGIVVRSMTIDNVPEFSLPPERIQPRSGYDSIQSPTKQHSAHNFVGHVQPDLYKWVALAGNLVLFAYFSKQRDLETSPFISKKKPHEICKFTILI